VLARLAEYLERRSWLRNKVGSILDLPERDVRFRTDRRRRAGDGGASQITELLASLNQPPPAYTRAIIEMAGLS
jgi:hypothetical protein